MDFINLNAGTEWNIGEKFTVDVRRPTTTATFSVRPTPICSTRTSTPGITVDLEANGDGVIKVTPSRDLNATNFWNWNALRIQPVQRELWQKGGRVSGEWAFADEFKLSAGWSRDKFHREITNWETTSCATDGGNPAPTASPASVECAAGTDGVRRADGQDRHSEHAVAQLHAALDAWRAVQHLRLRRRPEQRMGAA